MSDTELMEIWSVRINGDELLDEPKEVTPGTRLVIEFHEDMTYLKFMETNNAPAKE